MPTPQTLILSVAGPQAAQLGARSQRVFSGRDGSIGRSEDCDWVLASTGVSRIHAMVRFLNGLYFIEDRSTNGMLLNGAPLMKGDPSALKEGDRLQIDTFEIVVRMAQDSETIVQPSSSGPAPAWAPAAAPTPVPAPAPMAHDPFDFGLLDPVPRAPAPSHPSRDAGLIPGVVPASAGGDLDPLSFLDAPYTSPPAPAAAPPAPSWNHTSSLDDHFRPPTTDLQRQSQTLPENWDLTMGDFAPKPAARPPAAPMPPMSQSTPAPVTPPAAAPAAMPAEFDAILRIVADGVMDVLRARAEIKNTFRLPVTIIQRSENNPLKFAPTAEEAVQKIMGPSNGAFLSGPAAFDDAFDDIRCHQMAMLAGVRAAFESLLMHFNPDRYEHEVDGGPKRAAFGGKGRYWEKYRENFEALTKNPDDCFRRLFGDEFARAYEEQLGRLKSARRAEEGRYR